uniref:Pentatricopeptide repeat-containing protein At4g30700 family n=1 Tax=Cajanus cajan TaxID=3821 RepID=A0A151S9L2_CAJCA|nr:Pentatricopeptide repeat-containing protein At4g30700 family [Cajanus cajan]
MIRGDISRNTLLALISKACTLPHLAETHAQLIRNGYHHDLATVTKLTQKLFDVGATRHARALFFSVPKPDIFLFNVLIKGFSPNASSISFYTHLRKNTTLSPDNFTYAFAIAASPDDNLGMCLHAHAVVDGFASNLFVASNLVDVYCKFSRVAYARKVFDKMPERDTVSWNTMITGLVRNCCYDDTFRVLLFGMISKPDLVSYNAMISGFSCNGETELNEIDLARQLFDESSGKTVAAWNAMISGYTQNGLTETAITLFQEMMATDFMPNPVTITSILSACAQLGALSFGKGVHQLIRSKNLETNIYVSTALIDMYAKCGNISEAWQLFESMSEKNTVTWNTMIFGYGLHGYGHDALELFNEMLRLEFQPSSVTFLSVLYACSHAGMVREGDEIFHAMVNKYRIEPLAEHYACMVDILGRAGQLERALEFIRRMPVEPGPAVWGTLLGACMIHKDTNIARVASEKLFELDPGSVGYYVLLSNIYSVDRNFPKAASVREVVKKRKLSKTPGCTLIEINGSPHIFVSGDRSHSQTEAIYAKLEKLTGKMREMGYQSETVTALHDVEEEEKELMFNVHSEKLAIAFGLITTEPGAEIRIIKNLRVCLDCHTATKFISKITERVIVVRDANRFHHFKDGICSCGDYW